ncbi:heterokaryon incompatibility protein (het-6OR allele) [Fusarium bulbicola]|nr:heterokaryon incompatibility protein (het-6OR allele) [Fusarium bulbicola]
MPQSRSHDQKTEDRGHVPTASNATQWQLVPDNAQHVLEYPEIDLQSHQIRILHLLPGTYNNPLRCVLRTEFLDAGPKYQALSYVWGDPLDCRSIEVDGRQRSVTVNLFNALRRLRYPKSERRLWIDALCINQDNDVEKSHQVKLMSKIYTRTTEAILWLGDFSDGINATPNCIPREKVMKAFDLLKFMARDSYGCAAADSDPNTELFSGGYAALSCLVQLPWWHRAWTVQETVLPADATVVCGTEQLPFSLFVAAHNNSLDHYFLNCCKRVVVPGSFWSHLQKLVYAKECLREKILFMGNVLNDFRDRKASDPRDKMYAYFGLGSNISADYTLPHEEAFTLGMRSLIEEFGTLEIILRAPEINRSLSLPTWVPDWSADIDSQSHSLELAWYYLYRLYAACGDEKAQTRISYSHRVLDLRGLILEPIIELGDVMDSVDSMKKMVHRWQAPSGDEYPQGGTYQEASWRTLMCDMSHGKGFYERLEKRDNAEAMVLNEFEQTPSGVSLTAINKKGFITETGMIGISNLDIKEGDFISILNGGKMPFILRQIRSEVSGVAYQYIGQAYVHGIMDGEIMDKNLESEWISLI